MTNTNTSAKYYSTLLTVVGGNIAAQILNGGVSHQTGDKTVYMGESQEMKEIAQKMRDKFNWEEIEFTANADVYTWVLRGNDLILRQCIDTIEDIYDYFHVEMFIGKVNYVPRHDGSNWNKVTGIITGEMLLV